MAERGGGGRFSIIPARAYDDERLNGNDLRVLGVLGIYSDTHGWCWPSRNQIAHRARIDRANIRRHIQQLAACGYLEVKPRGSGQSHQSNQYRILHDGIPVAAIQTEVTQLGGVGSPSTPPGVSQYPRGGVFSGGSYILDKRPNKKRNRIGTQFPEDLTLEAPQREDATKAGIPSSEVEAEWDHFRNHHLARATVFSDWSAAWRTWVRNAVKFAERGRRAPSSSTPLRTTSGWTPEEVADWQRRYRALGRQYREKRGH